MGGRRDSERGGGRGDGGPGGGDINRWSSGTAPSTKFHGVVNTYIR